MHITKKTVTRLKKLHEIAMHVSICSALCMMEQIITHELLTAKILQQLLMINDKKGYHGEWVQVLSMGADIEWTW